MGPEVVAAKSLLEKKNKGCPRKGTALILSIGAS